MQTTLEQSGNLAMLDAACPVCQAQNSKPFIAIRQVPVHCNVLWATREEALNVPRGDILLSFCSSCGHVFNLTFDPALMEYTQQYENSLHFSPHFQRYAKALATRLIADYDLHQKDIVEIGSGKGEFLTLLCRLGANRGVGFDPGYVPDPERGGHDLPITFVQDFYSERYVNYPADLICCRHVLEHIPDPRNFIATVRQAVGARRHTVVFFEVPNVLFMLRDLSIWDIIYEHCAYYSSSSLAYLFQTCGFVVLQLQAAFGGQFLAIEARLADQSPSMIPIDGTSLEQLRQDVATFATNYRQKVETWGRRLAEWAHTGQRVVVWGAGSKGVTFLNVIEACDQIEYVVDLNPRKHGKYVAGSGQQIVAPVFLRDYHPDVVIVMNPLYINEIQQMMCDLGLKADVAGV